MEKLADIFGPLSKYHSDNDVFEFCVDSFDDVYVEKSGKIINDEKLFKNEKELYKVINNILESVDRKISSKHPYVDTRLADGTRIVAIIPPMSTKGPTLLVKKPIKQEINLDQLIQWKAVSEKGASLIREAILAGKNIVLTGLAGTGKVTMLNALISEINPEWRVVSVEKKAEILVERKRYVSLETVKGTPDSYLDLIKKAYHLRADYLVGTRIEGSAAIKFLEYMRGETSVLIEATANGASDFLKRMEVFGLTSQVGFHREDLQLFISDAVDMIITMNRGESGRRFIEHIAEVKGLREDGKYEIESLYIDQSSQEKY